MGYVRVKVKVGAVEESAAREEVELLADSGAAFALLPRQMLLRLGVRAQDKQRFKLANGSIIERETGWMRLELGEKKGYTRVIFGEEGDTPVLGVIALEELELKINPVTGKLEPLELLLLGAVPFQAEPSAGRGSSETYACPFLSQVGVPGGKAPCRGYGGVPHPPFHTPLSLIGRGGRG